jgi:hypothetical protein
VSSDAGPSRSSRRRWPRWPSALPRAWALFDDDVARQRIEQLKTETTGTRIGKLGIAGSNSRSACSST